MKRLKRKDVVAIAENDPEYGRCGTCKHYQYLATCSACSRGSRYCFDWRNYAKDNADVFADAGRVC